MNELLKVAYHVAGIVGSEHFPRGELAAFRRWKLDEKPPIPYYRLAAEHIPPDLRHGDTDQKWLFFVHLIGLLVPMQGKAVSIGRALHASDFNERRVHRLLSSEHFYAELERAVRWLAAKSQYISIGELFDAVFYHNDQVRMRIARQFFDQELDAGVEGTN